MIKVNLLPPEFRKVEGTPIARFVALVAGVFLTASALSGWAYVHFGMLKEVRDERIALQEDLVQKQALADRSEALANEFKEYQKRRDTIEKIGDGRVLWSRSLDLLADLIHNEGDTTRHQVWLRDISTGRGGGSSKLRFKGFSGGEEWSRLSDFHRDLKDSEDFFSAFSGIDAPAGKRRKFDDGRLPVFAVEFAWGLQMKPKAKKK